MAKRGGQIIIKRVKKGGHAGHHGGAWKVAYADFVTAMMAFFLLLWLLNVTTDVQKRGIADYFEPSISSKSQSGAGGVLGGTTIGSPGSMSVPLSQPNFTPAQNALRQPDDGNDGDDSGTSNSDQDGSDNGGGSADKAGSADSQGSARQLSDAQLQKQLAHREEQRFEQAKKALEQAVNADPQLQSLAQNLKIDETPEGLRIQLVDQDKAPMFPLGSPDLLDPAKKLLALVSQVVQKLPNKITITGHTDSTQYATGAKYTNWELSADRANATRREFLNDGLAPDRLAQVIGMADQDPIDKANPSDPQNRRISIVLLRQAGEIPGETAAPGTAPAQPVSQEAADKNAAANGAAAAPIPLPGN